MMTETIEREGRRRRHSNTGRPSKGNRVPTWAQLPYAVWKWVNVEAKAYNSSISQIVADLVCVESGHRDLVRDLNKPRVEEIALPLKDDRAEEPAADELMDIMTRVPEKAWMWVDDQAAARSTSLKQIVADVVCRAAGHPELVRVLDRDNAVRPEVLPLAI